MQPYTKYQETALLLLRLIIAAIFLYAAYAKLFIWTGAPEGMSASMVNLVKFLSIVEPLGALALIAGFLTRWAASGLAIIMVGAVVILRFTMHTSVFTGLKGTGLDYNLLILAGCIALMTFGAGRLSVDAKRGK